MMSLDLTTIVKGFATGLMEADRKRPQAINTRSHDLFQPGIGPHSEAQTIELVMKELEAKSPDTYRCSWAAGVPYPDLTRQKCDLCLGASPNWAWVLEVKMVRFLGDNGKPNDNILMHVLSPYPAHRSALTDCQKLVHSSIRGRKAILIYGYDHADWSLDPAIEAFEILARTTVRLGERESASFDELIHPVHNRGRVFAWELITR